VRLTSSTVIIAAFCSLGITAGLIVHLFAFPTIFSLERESAATGTMEAKMRGFVQPDSLFWLWEFSTNTEL